MFAVIKTGGKQYKVALNSLIKVEKISAEPGTQVEFKEILMVGSLSNTVIGTPTVKNAYVTGTIVGHKSDAKIIVFKKKRRKNYRRKLGHKQSVTQVRILDIVKG